MEFDLKYEEKKTLKIIEIWVKNHGKYVKIDKYW